MSILTKMHYFHSSIFKNRRRLSIQKCIFIGIFTLEWVLNVITKVDYILSFFWLDLIATISFIQDIDWVMTPVLGYGSAR